MKYPFVIFFRHHQYSIVDSFFIQNTSSLHCTLYFTNTKSSLNKLFNSNYQLLVTYGKDKSEYYEEIKEILPERILSNRWIHFTELLNINEFSIVVNKYLIQNCLLNRELVRPLFSLFTSSYNSYNKILRVYESLKKQTLKDWEWVIIDDSPDDTHFQFLRENMLPDERVRLYRRGSNNGSIGNVKNEAVSLCRGKYVLEMDHDDEILQDVLQDSYNLFETDEEIGFIYMDFINIYENGNNFSYGNHICKGYGGYYCQKYNNKWAYVYITPNINNITLSHLVCCPNHPRIWRRETLLQMGNYCEFLPICDDYEILLRTALHTKIAKIHKLGYVQYMNESNNNFSLIRNKEINRIGPQFISPLYYEHFKINEEMIKVDCHEDEKYIKGGIPIWLRNSNEYKHIYCNLLVNDDYDCQYCIVGIDSLIRNIDNIRELYKNPRNDFIVLESKSSIEYLWSKLDYYELVKMKCYVFIDYTDEMLIHYFMTMYKSANTYEIINTNNKKIKYNTDFNERYKVINHNTLPTDKYLEIGVEYCFTYNNVHFQEKTGVDPDPKKQASGLVIATSDSFFENLYSQDIAIDIKYDVIFIDGMHQVEYVVKDINHSIEFLNENGKLFIDDILPLTYDEQLKIPNKHYYEKGIVKYGEPWTGDVWKVLYYILKYHKEDIQLKYFYHINYRGVAMIQLKNKFRIEESKVEEINLYHYFEVFDDYISLLSTIE